MNETRSNSILIILIGLTLILHIVTNTVEDIEEPYVEKESGVISINPQCLENEMTMIVATGGEKTLIDCCVSLTDCRHLNH